MLSRRNGESVTAPGLHGRGHPGDSGLRHINNRTRPLSSVPGTQLPDLRNFLSAGRASVTRRTSSTPECDLGTESGPRVAPGQGGHRKDPATRRSVLAATATSSGAGKERGLRVKPCQSSRASKFMNAPMCPEVVHPSSSETEAPEGETFPELAPCAPHNTFYHKPVNVSRSFSEQRSKAEGEVAGASGLQLAGREHGDRQPGLAGGI